MLRLNLEPNGGQVPNTETQIRTASDYIWRYVATAALAALGGVLTGQFIPNRNIATTQELNDSIRTLQTSVDEQNREIGDLKTSVAQLTGELKARGEIAK
jgi:ABC-type transporter Mla subunit MlaD